MKITKLDNDRMAVNSFNTHKAQGLTTSNMNIILFDGMTEIDKIKAILTGIDFSYSLDPRVNINRSKVFTDYFNSNKVEDTSKFFKSIFSVELTGSVIERFIFVLMYHREAIDKACMKYRLENSLTSKTKTKTHKI